MIEVGKSYTTRDGRDVRIYATDHTGDDNHPVCGAVLKNNQWYSCKWTEDGKWTANSNIEHPKDLIESKTIDIWIVTFSNPNISPVVYFSEPPECVKSENLFSIVKKTITTRYREGLDK